MTISEEIPLCFSTAWLVSAGDEVKHMGQNYPLFILAGFVKRWMLLKTMHATSAVFIVCNHAVISHLLRRSLFIYS